MVVLDSAHGDAAKKKFDAIVITEGWHAENELTQAYYEEHKDQIEAYASLKKDLRDPEFQKCGTLE